MMGISKIVFKINNDKISIFFDSCTVNYNDYNYKISKDKLLCFLKKILKIIHNWNHEHIDLNIIDGDDWRLNIYTYDEKIENYKGNIFPINFDKLYDLFINLIKEVK